MALLDIILGPIETLFNRIFGGTIVAKLVTKIREGFTHVLTLRDRIDHLAKSIVSEVRAFRNWKEDFQIKNKVVNLPTAVDRTRDFIQTVRNAWDEILALIRQARDAFGPEPQKEAEELATELGDLSNIGEGLLKKLPKLAKGLEKLLGIVALVVDSVVQASEGVDHVQKIVDAITAIREEIESGSTFFLSQKNRRKTVHLDDGTVMKIRIGNLHS